MDAAIEHNLMYATPQVSGTSVARSIVASPVQFRRPGKTCECRIIASAFPSPFPATMSASSPHRCTSIQAVSGASGSNEVSLGFRSQDGLKHDMKPSEKSGDRNQSTAILVNVANPDQSETFIT